MAEHRLRCAIYTRKSTEDGLEQEFNSLDAQYEACAAYITSQRHEGWLLLPERYDDGGFSGGTMARPGLKRLLTDVAAGKIDIILIYKIDRLTRSLADFAKIVEVLDKAGASFVSVTQSFNTTTSMGRLTLNMLLSFAQFEREVTGERIRDKIAASKRKGLWMGGPVPLGYDVKDRKLVVNEIEANLVRHIMQRYLALGSVQDLVAELARDGHHTKLQARASGPHRGGCPFRRGTLYHLLTNRIYLGEIVHKGEAYPGEHQPIVSQALWQDVQATIKARASGGARRLNTQHPSLLVGLLRDGEGRAMSPSHATKSNRRYRYYVTRPDALDGTPAWRVSAHDLEKLVCSRTAEVLLDRRSLSELLLRTGADPKALQQGLDVAERFAATLRNETAAAASILAAIVRQVALKEHQLDIEINVSALLRQLGQKEVEPPAADSMVISCQTVRVRRGHEVRLVIPGASAPAKRARNEKLIALLAEAQSARALAMTAADKSLNRIAADHGRCRTRLSRLLAITCLAPDIVSAVTEGRQPPTLTAAKLLRTDLPLSWAEQRLVLGFA